MALALAVFAPALALAPGFLVLGAVPAVRRRLGSSRRWWCLAFPVSIFSYLPLYLLLNVAIEGGFDVRLPSAVFLGSFLAQSGACLFAARRYRRRLLRVVLGSRRAPSPLAGLTVVLCASYAYLFLPTTRPISDFDQPSVVTQMKGAWRAHDNTFQSFNAKAIAEHEPFSKYYGANALIYQVQDREMGAGVVLSVLRRMIEALSPRLADSFFAYTLLGLVFNVTAYVPLCALASLAVPRPWAPWVALVPFLTPFGLLNSIYTWFKLAGASCTLSGIYLWRSRERRLLDAVLVGTCWGVAINFHLSAALLFPIAVMVAMVRSGLRPATVVTAMVFGFSLPWSLVKRLWLEENYVLLREFFLAGQKLPYPKAGLGATIAAFFAEHPFVAEQIPKRTFQLQEGLQLPLWGELIDHLQAGRYAFALRFWHDAEHGYAAICYAPFLATALLAFARPKGIKVPLGWLTLGLATALVIIVASYPHYTPALTYTIPSAASLLVILGGTTLAARSGSRVAGGFLGIYLAVSVARLVALYLS